MDLDDRVDDDVIEGSSILNICIDGFPFPKK
jgi:hypothetical protein